jgi:hypothetical protein
MREVGVGLNDADELGGGILRQRREEALHVSMDEAYDDHADRLRGGCGLRPSRDSSGESTESSKEGEFSHKPHVG